MSGLLSSDGNPLRYLVRRGGIRGRELAADPLEFVALLEVAALRAEAIADAMAEVAAGAADAVVAIVCWETKGRQRRRK